MKKLLMMLVGSFNIGILAHSLTLAKEPAEVMLIATAIALQNFVTIAIITDND